MPSSIGSSHQPSDADWKKLPPHPRLFADTARIAAVKEQTDTVSTQLMALLKKDADAKLTAAPLIYPPAGFLFDPVRKVQGRILSLALTYRLTGDKRYGEKAKAELLQLADLPEWRTSHFLDTGEASLAAGIGLDWLYDYLTPSERDRVVRAIVNNALLPSLETKEGAGGWVDGDFNWNSVCHGGLVVGALAVAEREPELARKIVERALRNMPHAEATYNPDGSYPEGPSYWSYGTTFHVLAGEALRSVFGSSYGLAQSPGFLKTADFTLQMVGPTGQDYDFSDYHAENQNEPVMLWFARQRKNSHLADAELRDVAGMAAGNAAHKNVSRHVAFELLWWDNTLSETATREDLPLHWTAGGKLPIAVLRSSWNDPNATFVAVKGGTPNGSHAHMDVGSFILEADGVRWALDLGTENYNVMRAAKIDLWNYTQNSSRWTTFRVGPEGHNLLRFNGQGQDVSGKAEIRVLPSENGVMGNAVTLSSLYPQVKAAERRIKLFPDRSVVIQDEWTTGNLPVTASWQWLTRAQVTRRNGQEITLHQDRQSLQLTVEPATAIITVEDVSQPKNPQDSPNPGLTRLVITFLTPAHTTATLRVKAVPGVRPSDKP